MLISPQDQIFISENGAKINYWLTGKGSLTLVFIHGFTCDHTDWKEQVKYFSQGYQVLTLDLHGHGLSEPGACTVDLPLIANDIAQLINRLELNAVVLIGHSMGCRVALHASTKLTHIIKGVVLLDGVRHKLENPEDRIKPLEEAIERVGYNTVVSSMFDAMFFPPYDAKFKQSVIARAQAADHQVMTNLMRSMPFWDVNFLSDVLDSLDVSVLCIQATFTTEEGNWYQLKPGAKSQWLDILDEKLRDCRIVEWYDCSHFVMIERHKDCNDEIQSFLQDLS